MKINRGKVHVRTFPRLFGEPGNEARSPHYDHHFDNDDVTAIESDSSAVIGRCTDMLKKWLEGHGRREPRTWSTLLGGEAATEITLAGVIN